MSFKPGDVVVLKSGSQTMTIERIDEGGDILCVWSDGKKVDRLYFSPVVLKPYEPSVSSFDDF